MNLEKIQSKDQRPLISCFVIIVSHSRPLPTHNPAHCAPLLQHWAEAPPPHNQAIRLHRLAALIHSPKAAPPHRRQLHAAEARRVIITEAPGR